MMTLPGRFSAALAAAVLVTPITFATASAQSAGATIDRASQAFTRASTVRATFEQTLTNPLTGSASKATGELALAQPNRASLRFTQPAGDRVVAQLMPGHVASHGRNAEVVRGRRGDFAVAAHINGAKVPMVIDTGATSVVLTQEAARAAGLPIEVLDYSVNVDTANGRTRAAPVTLARLAVGNLTEHDVPALVVQRGQLHNNLLGMSFLNRLDSWEVRGDKLRMRGTP